PVLDHIRGLASSGLNQSLGDINLTGAQRLDTIASGKNAYYNTQSALNQQAAERSRQRALNQFSRSGLETSTAFGAYQGQLTNDALLNDLMLQQQAVDMDSVNAIRSAQAQQSVLAQLANLMNPAGSMASNSLITGLQHQDAANLYNTQQ